MTKKQTPAQLLKKELKEKFQETKFNVTYKSYSGGDSIHVFWIDGPSEDSVQKISYKYEMGSFDGMTDSYNYKDCPEGMDRANQVKYVMLDRSLSNERNFHWLYEENTPIVEVNRMNWNRVRKVIKEKDLFYS